MAAPYTELDKPGKTLAQKILRRPNKGDAFAEINNILASAEQLRDVNEAQLQTVAENYRVNIHAKLRHNFEDLYERYVEHCLGDQHFTDDEVADLAHLKHLLGVAEPDARRIHNEIAQRHYEEAVDDAVDDGRLTDDERAFLEALQQRVQLPDSTAKHIYEQVAVARVQRSLDDAVEDRQVSPDEDAELRAVAESLGVELSIDEENLDALERMRLYWVIENAEVPPIDVAINLPRTEQCYFQATSVDWYEHRTVSTRINYSGPTARIRIAKGIYWRAGSIKAQSISSEELKQIDSGDLYITSKRLIFMGSKGNKNIRLNKILTFEPFSNGIDVQKDTGRSPFLSFGVDIDLATLILSRAIRDANS